MGWRAGLRMWCILSQVPRGKRAVLDADGMYNPIVSVDGYDRNHHNDGSRVFWGAHCDALTDTIFQPTREPIQASVIPVPFYGYDPALRLEPGSLPKRFDIVHVGHNWWRWRERKSALLHAIE